MLAKEYPDLEKEWDYEKNANDGVFFEDISAGSTKKFGGDAKINTLFSGVFRRELIGIMVVHIVLVDKSCPVLMISRQSAPNCLLNGTTRRIMN